MNDQVPPLSGLSASRTETGKSNVLSNQSLLYLSSPSLYMLCGNLDESLKSMEDKGIMGFQGQTSPHQPETDDSPLDCRKRSSQKCASLPAASAEEEPTAKRLNMEQNDRPISLVLSKVRENNLTDTHIFAYSQRKGVLYLHSLSDIDVTHISYAVQNFE